MATAAHLTSRFFGSLRPGGPSAVDRDWVARQLLPSELSIWSGLTGPDRRHSVGVAHRVVEILGTRTDRAVIAAALLHDSGKTVSGLRTPGRVIATLVGAVVGRDETRANQWCSRPRPLRRIGQYWLHPQLGADRLEAAGSDSLTVTWTRQHHLPPTSCTLDPVVADALRSADDD
jgi:hypothetical protein